MTLERLQTNGNGFGNSVKSDAQILLWHHLHRAKASEPHRTRTEEKPVQHEIPLQGSLLTFLAKDFYPGYFPHLRDVNGDKPYYEEIPKAVTDVLYPLVALPGTEWYLVSNPARCITWGEVPEHIHSIRPIFKKKAEKLPASAPQSTRDFLNKIALSDLDTDFQISGISMLDLAARLREIHHITEIEPPKLIGYLEDGTPRYQHVSHFSYGDHFMVDVVAGAIETNLPLDFMRISIKDRETGRSLTHIDIGEIPKQTWKARIHKRFGETFQKQEKTAVRVYTSHGELGYKASAKSRQIMHGEDVITTESRKRSTLLEVPHRSGRVSAVFPRPRDRSKSWFMEGFSSEHILELWEHLQYLVQDNGEFGNNIPPSLLFIPASDMAVHGTINPFHLEHFSYYSGGILLWPEVCRKLTIGKRRHILQSTELNYDIDNGQPIKRQPGESLSKYIRRQEDAYRDNHETEGVEAWVTAMKDAGILVDHGDPWTTFLSMFNKQEDILFPKKTLGSEFNQARDLIRELAPGTPLQQVIDRYDKISERNPGTLSKSAEDQKRSDWNRIQSVALCISLLKEFPFVTARALKRLYKRQSLNFNGDEEESFTRKLIFAPILLDLKLLGLLAKEDDELWRRDKKGNIVPIVYYSRQDEEEGLVHRLEALSSNSSFFHLYHAELQRKSETPISERSARIKLTRTINKLRESYGIGSLEVLETLTWADFWLLVKQKVDHGRGIVRHTVKRKAVNELMERAQEILTAGVDHLQAN